MTATAPAVNIATGLTAHALAVLPAPQIDQRSFTACYEKYADNLSLPTTGLSIHARLIRWAITQGVIVETATKSITDDRAGLLKARALGQHLAQSLLDDATDRARQWCVSAGFCLPDDAGLELQGEFDTKNSGLVMRISHNMNCRLADISDFYDHVVDRDLQVIGEKALDAMTDIAQLAVDAPMYRKEDELGLVYFAGDGMFVELAEEWWLEGPPSREDALAQARESSASYGMSAEQVDADFEDFWQRFNSLHDPEIAIASAPDAPRKLMAQVEKLRRKGKTGRVLDYAEAVSRLWQYSRDHDVSRCEYLNLESDMSHRVLIIAHTPLEMDYCVSMTDHMMNGEDSPSLTLEGIDEAPYEAVVNELACCYAQGLAYESMSLYGFFGPFDQTDNNNV